MPTSKQSRVGNFFATTPGHCWIFALSALVIILIDRSWLYPGGGTIDPWVYYGYFFDYPSYVTHFFPNAYYGTRLPWIVPGYVMVHIFPRVVGTYLFVVFVYYITVYSFYFAMSIFFNRHVGLLSALLFAGDFYFLRSITWYYVDGAIVMYFSLTLLALALAYFYARKLYAFMAGWFCVSILFCHLLSIVLVPGLCILGIYMLRTDPRWKGRMLGAIGFAVLGAVCCQAFFGVIHFVVAREFFFFMPQLRLLLSTDSIAASYKLPVERWLPIARWAIVPAFSILIGLVAALKLLWRKSAVRGIGAVALLASLGTLLMLIVLEWAGLFYYQLSYYTSFLGPLCYLIIGAAIYMVTDGNRLEGYLVAGFAFLVYGIRDWTHFNVGTMLFPHGTGAYVVLASLAVLTAAVLLLGSWKPWQVRSALFLVGFAACAVGAGEFGFYRTATTWELLNQAHLRIRSVSKGQLPRLWYSDKAPYIALYRTLGSIYLWQWSIVNEDFPAIGRPDFRPIRAGDLLVICADSPEVGAEARQSLAAKSLRWDEISTEQVRQGGEGFWLVFGRAVAASTGARSNH